MGCGASNAVGVSPMDSASTPHSNHNRHKRESQFSQLNLKPTTVGLTPSHDKRDAGVDYKKRAMNGETVVSDKEKNGRTDPQKKCELEMDKAVGHLLLSVAAQLEEEVRMADATGQEGEEANYVDGGVFGSLNCNGTKMISDPVLKLELGNITGDDLESSQDLEPDPKKKKKEKRAKEAQKKTKKKDSKVSLHSSSGLALEDEETAPENIFIPLFVFKCVKYIESEGMNTEGLYRISGNKAQGELFQSKFAADHNVDIASLEIPVNAIATLLKSFFSDLNDALIPSSLCDELMEAAEMGDKSGRLLLLRGVIKKLPAQNYEILKFIISHLYRVAEKQEYNSMSSGNLAKCWWPTLIRLQFKSYEKMVQGTQVPEDIIHTLIEQSSFFFYGGDEV